MPRIPEVDMSRCVLCDGCVEVCPDVFRMSEAGFIEVLDLSEYPEDCVQEAMKYCPTDCIFWQELE